MKKLNKRKTRLLRVMSLGLIAVVFSVYTIVGVNAKYKSETTATATAQVASFNIVNNITDLSETLRNLTFNFYDPTENYDIFDFTVTSSSEVSVKYDVIVTVPATNTGSAWLNIVLNSSVPDDTEIDSGSAVYTFQNVGTFNPTDSSTPFSHSLTLTFTVADAFMGNPYVLDGYSDVSFSLPFTVQVHTEQID